MGIGQGRMEKGTGKATSKICTHLCLVGTSSKAT